jgi:hypothetical protein
MNERLGETSAKIIENCQPGDVFKLSEPSDLQLFEDEVAERFIFDEGSADRHYETWGFRKKLIDLIRPDGYFGPIKNISLSVIPDAYDRMFDFKERGKKYQGRKHPQVRTKFPDKAKETTVGFTLSAETKKGTLTTEVYYVPVAENTTTGQRATSITGGVINRYLATPEIIPPIKSDVITPETSKLAVGSTAVKNCISTMGDPRAFKQTLFQ